MRCAKNIPPFFHDCDNVLGFIINVSDIHPLSWYFVPKAKIPIPNAQSANPLEGPIASQRATTLIFMAIASPEHRPARW